MRAVVQDRYGPPDVLEVRSVARPAPTPTQVLIEVEAAGVDRGTWHLMSGQPYLVRLAGFGLRRPKQPIPGLDVSGRVVEVGADVTRFTVGDTVFGLASGSFAEYAAAEESKLAHRPASLDATAAAVAPVSGITALQALTDVGHVEAGQHVLVLGASGGVGTYAVQIAKALGAEVSGVASGAKLDLVRALGADHVIDYTTEDFAAGDVRYDLIIDIGGRSSVRRLRRALAPRGTVVIVGGEGGGRFTGGIGRQLRAVLLSPFVRQRLTTFISKERHDSIERLAEFITAGTVVPAVERTVDLEGVADAIRDLDAGRVRGKVAVRVR